MQRNLLEEEKKSKSTLTFFAKSIENETIILKMLQLTAFPDAKNVKAAIRIVKQNPKLILTQSTFTEPCGRAWKKNLSVLCNMLLGQVIIF